MIISSISDNSSYGQSITEVNKQEFDDDHTHYREEYETYETLQRKPIAQRKKELKTKYVEFAETEFSRQSFYLPIPFISHSRLHMIPARTLSQLIRQHIAHNRVKHLELQNAVNASILQGVSRITELRQTPYRRWSANTTRQQSYEEKRRQWKAELKRRLQSHKIPTRIIPPLLIRGGGHTSIQTDREPTKDRYFVTYSPQTRIYQVSRRPPPFLYTTDRDILPEEIINDKLQPTIADSGPEIKSDMAKESEPTTNYEQTTTTPSSTFLLKPASTSTTSTTTTTTTTMAPIFIVLQKAESTADDNIKEHRQQVFASIKPVMTNREPIKQVLFIDDYEQVQGDTDDEESEVLTTPVPVITATGEQNKLQQSATIDRIAELEKARNRLQQQLFQEKGDENFAEEDGEDDDLFFFKPVAPKAAYFFQTLWSLRPQQAAIPLLPLRMTLDFAMTNQLIQT